MPMRFFSFRRIGHAKNAVVSSAPGPRFVLGAPLAEEESRSLEFKQVTSANPVDAIKNAADEYAVAFLNSEGGTILWGVRDADRVVVGVPLPPAERSRLRQSVMSKLHSIQPSIDPTRFRLELHPVHEEPVGSHLVVVELIVPAGRHADPFHTGGGEVFVRVDGVKKKLTISELTAWIRNRANLATPSPPAIREPKLTGLIQRVREIFSTHGLEPTQWARFFKLRRAPFSIALTDLATDTALLAWLNEEKINWIAETFLLRREWIDGESSGIHQRFYFHKRPQEFFQAVSQHVDALIWEDVRDSPSAYFVRWGQGEEWKTKGNSCVFVIVRVPIVRLSEELYIYKYLSDFEPYPWDHPRTNIQLRAWTRLLLVNKSIPCFGCDISYDAGNRLFNADPFLHEFVDTRMVIRRHIWEPENHALFPNESVHATDTDTLPAVIGFLKDHGLPYETRF